MIIDAWMQHPTERQLNCEMFDSLRRWAAGTKLSAVITPEMTITAMDQGGVTIGMAAAWSSPEGDMISNDEVAAFARQYSGRIVGVASANLYKPMEAVRELRRAVKTLGFKALRIVPWLWGLPPNDRRYYPLYAECIELGVPFCTQVGHNWTASHLGNRTANSLPCRIAPQDPRGAARSIGRRQGRRSPTVVEPHSGAPARRAVALGSGRARRADGGPSKNVPAGDGRHLRDDLGGVWTFQRGGAEAGLGADAQNDCVLVADGPRQGPKPI